MYPMRHKWPQKLEIHHKTDSFPAVTATLGSCVHQQCRVQQEEKGQKATDEYWISLFMGHHPQPTLHFCVPSATWKEVAFETWCLLPHLYTETSDVPLNSPGSSWGDLQVGALPSLPWQLHRVGPQKTDLSSGP